LAVPSSQRSIVAAAVVDDGDDDEKIRIRIRSKNLVIWPFGVAFHFDAGSLYLFLQ